MADEPEILCTREALLFAAYNVFGKDIPPPPPVPRRGRPPLPEGQRKRPKSVKGGKRGRPRGITGPFPEGHHALTRLIPPAEIVRLRDEGKTLQEIGTIAGITRERVRQILRSQGYTKSRIKEIVPQPFKRIRNFRSRMINWLFECGYRYCNRCRKLGREWVRPIGDFMPGSFNGAYCRTCNNERGRLYYNGPAHDRLLAMTHRKDRRIKQKEYSRAWIARNREMINAKQRERYHTKMETDPEYAARTRELWRKRTAERRKSRTSSKTNS